MRRFDMKNIFVLCATLLLVVVSGSAFAQDAIVLTGKVIDKQGAPVSGVSVSETDNEQRTVRGTTTDIDGNFAIKVSDVKHRLTFSAIGYKSREDMAINTRRIFNITLEQSSNDMEEVIVVSSARTDNGMLPIPERYNTLATSKINAKDLEEMQATSIDQALQGRMAGLILPPIRVILAPVCKYASGVHRRSTHPLPH
ncbi:carboxypeptidase-like regulatory domain-containing protein [Niabella sp. W65]|nr:carboxypeptidase-like regulatory domain-containing protein [Niabella sp. W65]MCH7363930.1 carboxypeptidase-like regulatory domain-containing protein [Niabella sp. W65]